MAGAFHSIRPLISADASGGAVSAFEEVTTPGSGPPLHAHRSQSEVFHIIKGRHKFAFEDREVVLDTGGCIFIPVGTPHTFMNVDDADGIIHFELLPSGKADTFFHRLVEDFASIEDLPTFFAEHDIDLLGPPLS